MDVAELARRVHADGFVALPVATYEVPASVVEQLRTQVLNRYEEFLTEAANKKLDLKLRENAERLPGFYVREGDSGSCSLRGYEVAQGHGYILATSAQGTLRTR
ncbi:hypothetical protein L916_12402 [Phytophthora nicotianae]|uniref:Uncharacterized protein n=1 Tax=Phytophthora nicotianae TaxID=4792 RepID=W2IN14_PHYNI|nr:hypothetical protein L916_12402 [Phytophthora nicotianae]